MPVLEERQVRAALARGEAAPVHLLVGDDEVGKTPLIDALTALVEPGLQAFNVERVFANEGRLADAVGAIVSAARTLPLLGDRRVVLAMRCEAFLKPKRKGGASDEEDEDGGRAEADGEADAGASGGAAELERYLGRPTPETTLVLVAADMARNTRLAKALLKSAIVVEYWGLKEDREVKGAGVARALHEGERFVQERAREAGLRIRSDAVQPLLEHAGTDIAVLRNDIERVITYCVGRGEITARDVAAVVSGAVQVDEWALTRAIENRDARQALRQLDLALEAGQSPWQVLGQLAWFVRARLGERAPERVRPAVDAVFRADLALKSSGGDPQVLLERLVVELCGEDCGRPGPGRPGWRR
jgi:DNA polymerase-3 subunit delta